MFDFDSASEWKEFERRMVKQEEAQWKRETEPIPCDSCESVGRQGVMMEYQGIEYHPQAVLKQVLDEDSPGGFDYHDEVVNCPYATWRCPHGHVETDGY